MLRAQETPLPRSQAATNAAAASRPASALPAQFVNHREEATAHRELQDAVGHSASVRQAAAYQQMADTPSAGAPVARSSAVVQRALDEDFAHAVTTTVIAGETHQEINQKAERSHWARLGVIVVYEHEALPESGQKPDPLILRVVNAWQFLYGTALNFWQLVAAGRDVSEVPAIREQRMLTELIQDDLEEMGLAVDPRLPRAHLLLEHLCQGLPADEAALMNRPRNIQQYFAETKTKDLHWIDALIRSIHRDGSFGDVAFDEDSVRIERSRQMLKTINAAKPAKTIFKVGADHADDMQRLRMPHDPDVAILSKDAYVREFAAIDPGRVVSGNAVFDQYTNDML